jgi:hypothetical protein
MYVYMYMYI